MSFKDKAVKYTSVGRPEGSNNPEGYASLSKWRRRMHTLVGLLQITDKNLLSESDQFSVFFKLQRHHVR